MSDAILWDDKGRLSFDNADLKPKPKPKLKEGEEFVLCEECPVCGGEIIGVWGNDVIIHECGARLQNYKKVVLTYTRVRSSAKTSLSDSFDDCGFYEK